MDDSPWMDKEGNPISMMEWEALHRDDSYRQIGLTEIAGSTTHVSTVWLGINHNWSGEGPPIIFETMIFGGKMDLYAWRYATEREARLGHFDAVRLARQASRVYLSKKEPWEDVDGFRWLPDED